MSSSKKPTNFEILFEEIKNSEYEVKSLEEIVHSFKTGEQTITRSLKNNGDYPCITCTDIFESEVFLNEFKTFTDLDSIKTKTFVEEGDILIATSGYTTRKKSGGLCAFLGNEKPLAGNDMYVLKHNQNPKYLVNFLSTPGFKETISLSFKKQLIAVMKLYLKDIKKIKIPLPTLDLQEKIANFLSNFSEYDKQLKREQKARRKQFHFFKEQIFSELVERCRLRDVGWEIKSIGNFATEIYKGNDVHKIQIGTGDYPAITASNINGKGRIFIKKASYFINPDLIQRKKYCDFGDILITNIGDKKTVGNAVAYLSKDNCIVGENAYVIKHNQNPKFLAYALSTELSREKIENSVNSGIVFVLNLKVIKKLEIPLPPIEEQERIVEILDKFYDLSENPDKGLNKLIELNRKQYEYYRNLIFDQLKI